MGGRHPALQRAFPPWLPLRLPGWVSVFRIAPGTSRENLVPIKIRAVASFELQRNKACEFNLCLFFFFFPPQMMSGVEETEQH